MIHLSGVRIIMADEPEKPCDHVDEIKVGPAIGDDARLFVRHTKDHNSYMGVMRPVREGEPLMDNVFTVEPRDPENGVYKVTEIDIPRARSASGPPLANSRGFLDGWERTFGGRPQAVGQA
jgi:hypothetical protein